VLIFTESTVLSALARRQANKSMANKTDSSIEQKLDTMIDLLKHLLALELSKSGVTQQEICAHLHVSKSTVVDMLKGVKKEN
jgi:hypothetical protein